MFSSRFGRCCRSLNLLRFLSYSKYGSGLNGGDPIIMCHGLLGQKTNFHTVGKAISEKTGRTVFTLDMVNHGAARRSDTACYKDMALEVNQAIQVPQKVLTS